MKVSFILKIKKVSKIDIFCLYFIKFVHILLIFVHIKWITYVHTFNKFGYTVVIFCL